MIKIVVLLALATLTAAAEEPRKVGDGTHAFMVPVTVKITNSLGRQVKLHCKSKDNDLGEHVLAGGGSYEFKFRPNVWWTTLFFCSLTQLPNGPSLYFDAYNAKRDAKINESRCVNACYWVIEKDGLSGYDQFKDEWQQLYTWP